MHAKNIHMFDLLEGELVEEKVPLLANRREMIIGPLRTIQWNEKGLNPTQILLEGEVKCTCAHHPLRTYI